MAVSVVYNDLDGSQTDFPISFEYLSKDHVHATVDGEEVSFTFSSTYLIQITPAPSGTLFIYRQTPIDAPVSTFTDGSVLLADNLNAATLQSLYATEETQTNLPDRTADGAWDMRNLRVSNVADPTSAQDAATKAWVQNQYSSGVDAGEAQVAAEAAQAAAEAARDTAVASAATATSGADTASAKAAEASASATSASSDAASASADAASASASATSADADAATATAKAAEASASAAAAATFDPAQFVKIVNPTLTVLDAGFSAEDPDPILLSAGAFTPDIANGNFHEVLNDASGSIIAPDFGGNSGTSVVLLTNTATAGAVTLAGHDNSDTGDAFTVTSGAQFLIFYTVVAGVTCAMVKAV
jgi:hypothetical protein